MNDTEGAGDPGNYSYDAGPTTVLVAAADAPDRLAVAIGIIGRRVPIRLDWEHPRAPFAVPQVVAIEVAGVDDAILRATLPDIVDWAADCAAAVVIAMTPDQIDLVASVSLGGVTDLLVDPDIAACVAALTIAAERARVPAGVADVGREGDSARFERLNAEVARIADVLARLARDERDRDEHPPIVGDRTTAYGAPPMVAPTAGDIRRMIRARRARDQFFGPGYFEDPGWDMLLDLYAAELEGAQVSVSSLCIAAAVAPTTALRWIGRMSDAGWLDRRPDPLDRRRAYMALSTRASESMHGYMAAVRRAEPVAN
jgi:DNA-binding MarR family transcriptional regulator